MSRVAEIEDVTCIRDTDKAILVAVEGEEVWVPRSVVDDTSEVQKKGDKGELTVAEWFAQKQGWV